MARGADLAKNDEFEAAERAFSTAATLFRAAVDDVDSLLANAAPGGRGERGAGGATTASGNSTSNPGRGTAAPAPAPTPADKPAETAPRGNADPPPPVEPIPRPPKNDPPKVTPIPVRPTVQSALEAYERALSRRDENALRAVYPSVPRDVIDSWSKKDSGVKYASTQIIQTRDEFENPTRVRFECTFFYNFITNAGSPKTIKESRVVTLEKRGDNWDVVESRKR